MGDKVIKEFQSLALLHLNYLWLVSINQECSSWCSNSEVKLAKCLWACMANYSGKMLRDGMVLSVSVLFITITKIFNLWSACAGFSYVLAHFWLWPFVLLLFGFWTRSRNVNLGSTQKVVVYVFNVYKRFFFFPQRKNII